MGLKPNFKILADNKEITESIKERLISLRLTDHAGDQSDTLILELNDDPEMEIPRTGIELECHLGYDKNLKKMGSFIVDEVELTSPPQKIVITTRATPFRDSMQYKSLKSQKNRSWDGINLGNLVKTIAKEHNLKSHVSESLKNVGLPHLDQTNQSDLVFLKMLARQYDAKVKPTNGVLMVLKRAEFKTMSGNLIPVIKLKPEEVTQYRVTISDRSDYQSVVASYHDIEFGEAKEVIVGKGEPVKRYVFAFKDEATALARAKAKYAEYQRGKTKLDLLMPGRVDLMAEGRIELGDFRHMVDGAWLVEKVEYSLSSSGFSVKVVGSIMK